MKSYGDYLKKVTEDREKIRDEGNLDNEANKEQKEIIEGIKTVTKNIDNYAQLMSDNHLIKKI